MLRLLSRREDPKRKDHRVGEGTCTRDWSFVVESRRLGFVFGHSAAGVRASSSRKEQLCRGADRSKMPSTQAKMSMENALIGMICDEDTVTGLLLTGAGDVDLRKRTNFLVVDSKTTLKDVETKFRELCARDDVAVILISQYVADMIRYIVDRHKAPIPAVLEIPSKDHPYDPIKDSVLARVKHMFAGE